MIGGVEEQAIAAAHARLRADATIQFDLPVAHAPVTPEWVRALGRFLHAIAPALKWIGWGLIALAVAFLLWVLVRRLMGLDWRLRRGAPEDAVTGDAPSPAQARALLAEADALAGEGQFADAAHLLLLRGIEEIARRRPALLRPALTSRDIARADALPERARAAFATIAATVERSLFGARALGGDEWRAARAAYADFAFPESWGARR